MLQTRTRAPQEPAEEGRLKKRFEIAYVAASFGKEPPPGTDPAEMQVITAVGVRRSGALTPLPKLQGNVSTTPAWLTYSRGCLFTSTKAGQLLGNSVSRRGAVEVPGSSAHAGDTPTQNAATSDGRFVVNANFAVAPGMVASVSSFRIGKGCSVSQADLVPVYCATCTPPGRQSVSHVHGVTAAPNGLIYAPDMGADLIYVYRLNSRGKFVNVTNASAPAGCGPRHAVYHPYLPILYMICELQPLMVSYRSSRGGKRLAPYESVSLPGKAREIVVTPSATNLFLSAMKTRTASCIITLSACPVKGTVKVRQTIDADLPALEPRGMALARRGSVVLISWISGYLKSFRAKAAPEPDADYKLLELADTLTEGLPASPGTIAIASKRR